MTLRHITSISGATASGKSMLVQRLLSMYGGGWVRHSINRPLLSGELRDEYICLTEEEFKKRRSKFLWSTTYYATEHAVTEDEFFRAGKNPTGIAYIVVTPAQHELVAAQAREWKISHTKLHLGWPGTWQQVERLRAMGYTPDEISRRQANSRDWDLDVRGVSNFMLVMQDAPEAMMARAIRAITLAPL